MGKNKNNEEIQSRREFFKNAARKTLPILGVITMTNLPIFANAVNIESTSCEKECTASCGALCTGCWTGCTGCKADCQHDCKNTCRGGCQGGCGRMANSPGW